MKIEKLFSMGYLCDVNVSIPTFRAKLQPEELGLTDVPSIVELGHKKLVTDTVIKEFHGFAYRANKVADAYSKPFPFLKARFIPIKLFTQFAQDFESVKREFYQYVNKFKQDFASIKEQVLSGANGNEVLRRAVLEAIDRLERRWHFHMGYTVFQFSLPPNVEAFARNQTQIEIAEQVYNEQVEQMRTQVREFLRQVTEDNRKIAGEVADTLIEHIENGRAMRADTLRRIDDVLQRFDALNITGDTDIQEAINRVRQALANTNRQLLHITRQGRAVAEEARNLREIAKRTTDIDTIVGNCERQFYEV